jgi:alpha-tubulin suppressor-like RCC1 family protein
MLKQLPKYNRVTRLLQHSVAGALRQASSCTHALALCATIGLAASAAQAQVTGGVMAWGDNSKGQTTIPAAALSGVTAIAGGGENTVALKDGAVLVWGNNYRGLLTIPTGAQSGVTAIASGGEHTVALKNNGQVICWGTNGFGQSLGTDRYGSRLIGWGVPGVPRGSYVRIRGTILTGVTAIAGGYWHTIALKDGAVLAWGNNNFGQCDIPADARSGVTAIAGGGWHTIALKGGAVLAWGRNWEGQCTIPAAALSGVSAIAGGDSHTVALKDGAVLAWGANDRGQCTIPAAAQSGVDAIASGVVHTIALKRASIYGDGAVLAWGSNSRGQCNIPAAAQSGVTAIAAGSVHTIALRVPAPTITRVTPEDGQLAGGTPITIRGTNFVTGATIVRVGRNPATSVNVTSPTSLTAITPPGSIAGSVSVDVTTLGRTSSRPNAFTYESPLCPADLNGDGVVNSSDMIILLNAFGNCPPSPTSCPADLNGDGVVNALDVIILSNAYGDC